jgi:ABC-type transport system involved in Fe-S cluster assembly fused permease/ATPase subunit
MINATLAVGLVVLAGLYLRAHVRTLRQRIRTARHIRALRRRRDMLRDEAQSALDTCCELQIENDVWAEEERRRLVKSPRVMVLN